MMTRRKRPQSPGVFRLLVAVGIGGMAAAGTGCSPVSLMPSLDDELRAGLAHMVESAQDDLWSYRDSLATAPEATLAEIDFVSDARPSYLDPTFVPDGGVYTVLGVSSSPDGSTLTLATSAGAESGGGFFYQSRSAAVCFALRFPVGERAIHTDTSDCTDGHGHGLRDLADYARHGDPIPLDDFDVRRTVTEVDFAPLPCQCSSGGSCDCPGG